jgi:hypothetical protein
MAFVAKLKKLTKITEDCQGLNIAAAEEPCAGASHFLLAS